MKSLSWGNLLSVVTPLLIFNPTLFNKGVIEFAPTL